MLVDTFKFQKDIYTVIFTGSHYFFNSSCFGLIVAATRNFDKETEKESTFLLQYGNERASNCLINSFKERAKKYIFKNENKYIEKKVTFQETKKDLNLSYLDIKLKDR